MQTSGARECHYEQVRFTEGKTIMRQLASLLLLSASTALLAQPPQRPLIALDTWSLPGYHAVDAKEAFKLPAGIEFGQISNPWIVGRAEMVSKIGRHGLDQSKIGTTIHLEVLS